MNNNISRQDWIDHLQQAINFTPQDLDANRRGQYSELQRAQLEKYIRLGRGNPECQRAIFLILFAVLVGGLILLNTLMNGALLTLVSNPLIMPIVGIVVLVILLYAFFAGRSVRRVSESVDDMSKLLLEYAEGTVHISSFRGSTRSPSIPLIPNDIGLFTPRKHRSSRVTLGGQDFVMSKNIGSSFLEGATYRLYYVKYAFVTLLLSADLLDKDVR
jgi:hypothetical protein